MSDNWMRRCTRRRPHCAPRSRWLCAGATLSSGSTMKEILILIPRIRKRHESAPGTFDAGNHRTFMSEQPTAS